LIEVITHSLSYNIYLGNYPTLR